MLEVMFRGTLKRAHNVFVNCMKGGLSAAGIMDRLSFEMSFNSERLDV